MQRSLRFIETIDQTQSVNLKNVKSTNAVNQLKNSANALLRVKNEREEKKTIEYFFLIMIMNLFRRERKLSQEKIIFFPFEDDRKRLFHKITFLITFILKISSSSFRNVTILFITLFAQLSKLYSRCRRNNLSSITNLYMLTEDTESRETEHTRVGSASNKQSSIRLIYTYRL